MDQKWSFHHFAADWNISTTIEWIIKEVWTYNLGTEKQRFRIIDDKMSRTGGETKDMKVCVCAAADDSFLQIFYATGDERLSVDGFLSPPSWGQRLKVVTHGCDVSICSRARNRVNTRFNTCKWWASRDHNRDSAHQVSENTTVWRSTDLLLTTTSFISSTRSLHTSAAAHLHTFTWISFTKRRKTQCFTSAEFTR